MPVIGFMNAASAKGYARPLSAFLKGCCTSDPLGAFTIGTSFFDLYEAARAELRLLGRDATGDAPLADLHQDSTFRESRMRDFLSRETV
jgi:hypothetical protein